MPTGAPRSHRPCDLLRCIAPTELAKVEIRARFETTKTATYSDQCYREVSYSVSEQSFETDSKLDFGHFIA